MNKYHVDVDVVSVEEAQIALRAGYALPKFNIRQAVFLSEIEEAVSLGLDEPRI
jgi:hypothetical protein